MIRSQTQLKQSTHLKKTMSKKKKHFKYQVDIYCRPGVSVWVEANNPLEAEETVWEMIDNRTLFLTQEQKDNLINDILANVEEVQATGDMEGINDEKED